MDENEPLHKGIIIKSDKQNSAQGSVFYCRKVNNIDPDRELILKIYKLSDMKSYIKEIAVMKKLTEMQVKHAS